MVPDVEAGGGEAANESTSSRRQKNKNAANNDISRLSRSGTSLYELLDIPKNSTDQEIRKKYRRLALKYHPDKNPDNPEAEEMFKKINQANAVLSDEKKRRLYDKYGSFGLYLAEQVGEENMDMVDSLMFFQSNWFKACFCLCGLLTGCYFLCCLCCCCCCCCGKIKPKGVYDEEQDLPDVGDLSAHAEDEDKHDDVPVTSQPGARAPMPMPMPAPSSGNDDAAGGATSGERSPLKKSPAEAPPSYDSLYQSKDQKE